MIQPHSVYKVILEDRRDCCLDRMLNTEIRIGDIDANTGGGNTGDGDANPLCSQVTDVPLTPTSVYSCPTVMTGKYLVARKFAPGSNGAYSWHIVEVRIFVVK